VITVDELVVADEPPRWRDAGFTVEGAIAALGAVRARLDGAPDRGSRGITSWALRGAPAVAPDGTIDGLPTGGSERAPVAPGTHANGTIEIDHIVVATPDWPRTIAAFERTGFELRRERDAGRMRQGFFRAGPVVLEIVGGHEVTGDGPATFFGLALNVADLDATKDFYGELLSDPKPAVQPGRRIATLRHRDAGLSTAIAFMSLEGE
jgi:hypothetical protein